VEIPAARYLAACESGGLAFTACEPPQGVVHPGRVSLCVRTDEGVYDVGRLRDLVSRKLVSTPGLELRPGTSVAGAEHGPSGEKVLSTDGADGVRRESFDYVVNATYGGFNRLATWLELAIEPLRFDLCEMLSLRLPAPRLSVTVLDGPFTSLIGIGGHRFLLSHIHDSVGRSEVTCDGLPPAWSTREAPPRSNRDNLLRRARHYLPVLTEARDIESRWVLRAVLADGPDPDARPTSIRDHGFGCWSILGGKMVTSVSNARQIAREILSELEESAS
jgi:glycine/D-amino acid oxidase-like deaminating enzyme